MTNSEIQEKIATQKEITLRILEYLNLLGIDCCLAGGAIRNWYYGTPANDLDIYVSSYMSKSKLSDALGVGASKIKEVGECVFDPKKYPNSPVLDISEIVDYKYEGQTIQFIVCEPASKVTATKLDTIKELPPLPLPKSAVLGFKDAVRAHICTGINKSLIGPDGTVEYCKESLKDLEENTITVYTEKMSTHQHRLTLTNHLPKMIRYYPDHKVKIETGGPF